MKLLKAILWVGFILYLAFLVKVIWFKHIPLPYIVQNLEFGINFHQVNFIPFTTIVDYFTLGNKGISLENLVGNVMIFMPLGFLLPILIKKCQNAKSLLLFSFVLSLFFEITQLLFSILGSFDMDDLNLNTFGAFLGYLVFITLIRSIKSRKFLKTTYQ
ncbi:VanZ family protein [Halobacillus fulvus]|nr:VanZ family protein [Halobacillus fulvus]